MPVLYEVNCMVPKVEVLVKLDLSHEGRSVD
jgi:hypothetical protein